MIEPGVLRAFLAAEVFKLWNSRLARAALGTMCVTPLVAMAIVAALGSTASVFPEVALLIGSSFWLLAGLTSMLLAAGE